MSTLRIAVACGLFVVAEAALGLLVAHYLKNREGK